VSASSWKESLANTFMRKIRASIGALTLQNLMNVEELPEGMKRLTALERGGAPKGDDEADGAGAAESAWQAEGADAAAARHWREL
jgi:hypothetical protein